MVDEIPGFAGMYIGSSGELVVRIASEMEAVEGPLRDALSVEFPSLSAMPIRVDRAEHDYAALNGWKRAVASVLALDGVVSLDLDESRGKIVLGALDSAARVRAIEAALDAGVPEDVLEVVLEAPIRPLAGTLADASTNLSDRIRPLIGGTRMAYGSGSKNCTLGFLAEIDESGPERVALVNSHCTARLAELDGGNMYQSVWQTSGHFIGTEARDPAEFACPENPTRGCRNSDAALVLLDASVDWDFPHIARTTGSGRFSGSTTISSTKPRFEVVSEGGPLLMGMTLSKMGKVTGWTTGTVSETCKEFSITNEFTRLCNGAVQAGASEGDSGAPVFRETGEVEGEPTVALHGLLWGGEDSTPRFVFSQLEYIREDLGLFTTYTGQIAPF